MPGYVSLNRNGCKLQGALCVLNAVGGVAPILHSVPGCGVRVSHANGAFACQCGGSYGVSCTDILEKQVIFGGTSRLREQIKNTVKIQRADLYVVLSGCPAQIVGDDSEAMAKEAREQGYPVIHLGAPGFKGDSFGAYADVVTALLDAADGGGAVAVWSGGAPTGPGDTSSGSGNTSGGPDDISGGPDDISGGTGYTYADTGESIGVAPSVIDGVAQGSAAPSQAGGPGTMPAHPLVNVFGIDPCADPSWEGNLEALADLLRRLGFEYNPLFGRGSSVAHWGRAKTAAVNLAFGEQGLRIARALEERYGKPYVHLGYLPVGVDGTGAVLGALAGVFPEKDGISQKVLSEEREKFLYHLGRLETAYYTHHLQREIALVGPGAVVAALGSFLWRRLGQVPVVAVVTDGAGAGAAGRGNVHGGASLRSDDGCPLDWGNILGGAPVYFTEDGFEIQGILADATPEAILGSSLEEWASVRGGIPFIPIAYPLGNHIVLRGATFGAEGILGFLEKFCNAILGRP
ncbi:MAG: hypothetical protein LBR77_11800 [Lachnospiraceae bacterium]|nr:hypothetical protein [Lachnospiraceae bacterium]